MVLAHVLDQLIELLPGERGAAADMDVEAWRATIAAGWLSTVVPEDRGGQGLGSFDLALALEQAGRQLLMVPLNEVAADPALHEST